jgi:hypothetical protein
MMGMLRHAVDCELLEKYKVLLQNVKNNFDTALAPSVLQVRRTLRASNPAVPRWSYDEGYYLYCL